MPVRLLSVRRHLRGIDNALGTLALIVACSSPGEPPPLAPRLAPIDPTATPVPRAPGPATPLDPHTPGPILPAGDAGVPITDTSATPRRAPPGPVAGTAPSTSGPLGQ